MLVRSGAGVEPEPAKFRSKGAVVGAIKGKWPAPESELRSFKNLAPEQEPEALKFSRIHQPCYNQFRFFKVLALVVFPSLPGLGIDTLRTCHLGKPI